MNHWIGQSPTEGDGFLDVLPWALLGVATTGFGLYMLLKPKPTPELAPGSTRAAPLAPIASPSRFADLASVDLRFGQVRELYRMGRFTPKQTLDELDGLRIAAIGLPYRSENEAKDIILLDDRIVAFEREVEDYIRLQEQGIVRPSSAISGNHFPVVNRGAL